MQGKPSQDAPQAYHQALSLSIPSPSLKHSFRLVCDLEPLIPVGVGADGTSKFNWISFSGGYFEGSFARGTIVRGGQDSQHVYSPQHVSSPYAAQLSTRYLIKTADDKPAFIQIQTRGWRTGPKEVMERLARAAAENWKEGVPTPDEYKFRLCIEMETDSNDERYAWLNQAMFVGSGVRSGNQVIYDAYLIE